MQTYGLLYKQGHFVKNWQTRLFILSGGQLKYYVPGDTEAKGTIVSTPAIPRAAIYSGVCLTDCSGFRCCIRSSRFRP